MDIFKRNGLSIPGDIFEGGKTMIKFYTTKEVAGALEVTEKTVKRWIRGGRIAAYRYINPNGYLIVLVAECEVNKINREKQKK